MSINYKLVKQEDLTDDEFAAISKVQSICFSNVSDNEANEDFYASPVIRIMAYDNEKLVGCADIHLRECEFESSKYLLGGPSGFCVVENMRGKGIGSKLCELAMNYLKENNCDIAFLSVAKDSIARNLYHKYGFVDLPVNFSWKKSNGEIENDSDGMLAPVCNMKLYKEILKSDKSFYVGEGYW